MLNHPRAKLHLCGKREARPRRKMGHFTVLDDTIDESLNDALAIRKALGIGGVRARIEPFMWFTR